MIDFVADIDGGWMVVVIVFISPFLGKQPKVLALMLK